MNLVQVVPVKTSNIIGNLILTYTFYFSNLSHADHFKDHLNSSKILNQHLKKIIARLYNDL